MAALIIYIVCDKLKASRLILPAFFVFEMRYLNNNRTIPRFCLKNIINMNYVLTNTIDNFTFKW